MPELRYLKATINIKTWIGLGLSPRSYSEHSPKGKSGRRTLIWPQQKFSWKLSGSLSTSPSRQPIYSRDAHCLTGPVCQCGLDWTPASVIRGLWRGILPPSLQDRRDILYPPLPATPEDFALTGAGLQSTLEVYMGQRHHRQSGHSLSFPRSLKPARMTRLNNHGAGVRSGLKQAKQRRKKGK